MFTLPACLLSPPLRYDAGLLRRCLMMPLIRYYAATCYATPPDAAATLSPRAPHAASVDFRQRRIIFTMLCFSPR